MKILFVTDPTREAGRDTSYLSMCSVIGSENVKEIPYQYHYHDNDDIWLGGKYGLSPFVNPTVGEYFKKYPDFLPYDYRQYYQEYYDEAMKEPHRYAHGRFHWQKAIPPFLPDSPIDEIIQMGSDFDKDILSRIEDFDVIICTLKYVSMWMTNKIQEKRPDIPVVIIDDEDDPRLRPEIISEWKIKNVIMYLKWQMCKTPNPPSHSGMDHYKEDYPFLVEGTTWPSLTLEYTDLFDDSWENKKYDLQMRKSPTHWRRLYLYKGIDLLKKTTDLRITADYEWVDGIPSKSDITNHAEFWKLLTTPGLWNRKEYCEEIASSKISVCASGWASDSTAQISMGHFEASGFNTMLMVNETDCIHPHPLVDGEHCVFYDRDSITDFVDKVKYFIKNENECREIAKNGHEHVKKYWSYEAWGLRLLNKLEELI